MENYSDEDKKAIAVIVGRLFDKAKKNRYTYRQLRRSLGVKSHVTIYRWFHKKTFPSQTHIYHIKKFLGYVKA